MNTFVRPVAVPAITIQSAHAAQTVELGQRLGALMERGDLVLLIGPFGAGKTHLTKGIAQGLGADELVNSPSYVLINEYRAGASRGRFPIYHVDLYRLESLAELAGIGLEDALSGDGVCIIEWAEKALDWLPAEHLAIELAYAGETTRALRFEPRGARYVALVNALQC